MIEETRKISWRKPAESFRKIALRGISGVADVVAVRSLNSNSNADLKSKAI